MTRSKVPLTRSKLIMYIGEKEEANSTTVCCQTKHSTSDVQSGFTPKPNSTRPRHDWSHALAREMKPRDPPSPLKVKITYHTSHFLSIYTQPAASSYAHSCSRGREQNPRGRSLSPRLPHHSHLKPRRVSRAWKNAPRPGERLQIESEKKRLTKCPCRGCRGPWPRRGPWRAWQTCCRSCPCRRPRGPT